MEKKTKFWLSAVGLSLATLMPHHANAQAMPACPEKNVMYWQAFPPGGESDLSARHQQVVLKKKCGAIDTIIQYKAGAGGGLMWAQMNNLPGDGLNVVGINLPHIVFQPIEGEVQYKRPTLPPSFGSITPLMCWWCQKAAPSKTLPSSLPLPNNLPAK